MENLKSQMREVVVSPQPCMGLYDEPMWRSIASHQMALQRCSDCGAFRYPPGPACSKCLSEKYDWTAISGVARIISWVVFHKTYLPAYPAPYNVIAVRLAEGPVMVSNLEGPQPDINSIDAAVNIQYVIMADGFTLPRFRLSP